VSIDFTKYPKPRTRRHVSPNLYLPKDRINVTLSHYPPLLPSLDWRDIFTNGQPPDYLDVGCGMGGFLLETALGDPARNILGLEVRDYAAAWVADVIAGERPRGVLGNAACLWYSVANGLPFVGDSSLEKIFYFFPDPWFKKRHHYRRAFTLDFVRECWRTLKPTGELFLMTDVPAVDEYQRATLAAHGGFSVELCRDDETWGLTARTDQEKFSLRKNIPYTRLRCRRAPLKNAVDKPFSNC
jgi:tRNA (guanine-N7-)-methyltransferase